MISGRSCCPRDPAANRNDTPASAATSSNRIGEDPGGPAPSEIPATKAAAAHAAKRTGSKPRDGTKFLDRGSPRRRGDPLREPLEVGLGPHRGDEVVADLSREAESQDLEE